MKKLKYVSMFLMGTLVVLSSCKKTEDPIPSSNPDVKLIMNESNSTGSASTELGVKNGQGSVLMQVNGLTLTNNDMSRLYVYVETDGGSKTNIGFDNFKIDGNDNYYYDIPNASRNNFTLDMSASVSTNVTRQTEKYYFYFTSGSNFNVLSPGSNVKLGPGTITLVYNKLDVVATSQRLYSVCAANGNNGAYNLESLTGVTTTVNGTTGDITVGSNADMANMVGIANCAAGFSKGWTGQNNTTFVKANAFDYTNATKVTTATQFANGTPVSSVTGVATGDIYIAKLRNSSNYAVLKVTNVVDASGNNDYIEFDVKK